MTKSIASIVASWLLLASCATAPSECPRIPPQSARELTDHNFQERMQNFLQGKLPSPSASSPR